MKKGYLIMVMPLVLISCGGRSESGTEVQTDSVFVSDVGGMSSILEFEQEPVEMHVNGHVYYCSYKLINDARLDSVDDGMGNLYLDNDIELSITREGEDSLCLHKVFTKHSFTDAIPAKMMDRCILRGFNINDAVQEKHPERFNFITEVGDPLGNELKYQIAVSITANGQVSYEITHDEETGPISKGLTVDPTDEDDYGV